MLKLKDNGEKLSDEQKNVKKNGKYKKPRDKTRGILGNI